MIDTDKMRGLLERINDCTKPVDAADRSGVLQYIDALLAEVEGLRAARIAYANEFAPDAEGLPDTGNIHANIRKLKAEVEAARKALLKISQIEDKMFGADWDEIEEARAIANAALSQQMGGSR